MEDILVLTDENGAKVRFETLDIVEYEGEEYAVLYPADAGDDEPVHILRIHSEDMDNGDIQYEGLDDGPVRQECHIFLPAKTADRSSHLSAEIKY